MRFEKGEAMVVSTQSRAMGVFLDREAAEDALNELKNSGFPMDKVSIISKNADEGEELGNVKTSDRIGNQNVESPTAVVADAATTATWGSVLVGLSSLAIPGLGIVIAAGSVGAALVTTLAGIGLGTIATGNLVRAIADLGIPEEQARVYGDRLIAGNYLAIVDGTDEEIRRVEALLSNRGIQDWGVYHPSQG